MARRPRIVGPRLAYHVVARGNRREAVFLAHGDYETYLHRLATYRAGYAVTLFAYCLMPNHVHLVLRTGDAPLARFMQSLQQSYTQRFNRRYGQVGHAFQGRYKALLCETDEYLVTLVRYVHLNPVRAGLVGRAEDYPYSGHRAYLGGVATELIDPALVLGMVGGATGYVRLLATGTEDVASGAGAPRMPEALPEDLDSPHPALGPSRETLEPALSSVARALHVTIESLRGPTRGRIASGARALAAYVLVRRLGYRVTDVASVLCRNVSTASLAVREVGQRLSRDADAARQIDRLVEWLEIKGRA